MEGLECDAWSVMSAPTFNVAKLLAKKRDGGELDDAEIGFLVRGFCDGSVPNYQLTAFLAFVYCRGMKALETQVHGAFSFLLGSAE